MAKESRDDFSSGVKRALAERAGHCCSFPGCPQRTSGPSEESPEAVASVGVACHITAAAPGPGARRYDENLTTEETKPISTSRIAIWCRDLSGSFERCATKGQPCWLPAKTPPLSIGL